MICCSYGCSVTSLFRGGQHYVMSLGDGGVDRSQAHPNHPLCYSSPQHLVSHVPLDQEGQMVSDIQEEANSLIWGQEGEQPSHQNFPFPHRQHLQKVVCCLPIRERGEYFESCARKGGFMPAARPMPASVSALRLTVLLTPGCFAPGSSRPERASQPAFSVPSSGRAVGSHHSGPPLSSVRVKEHHGEKNHNMRSAEKYCFWT